MSEPLTDDVSASTAWERSLRVATVLFAVAAPWSIAAAQTAVVLVAVLTIGARIACDLRAPAIPWTFVFIGGFLVIQALSIPLGVHPERSLGCYRGSWVLLFPFVFWTALQSARTRRVALGALVASGTVAALYGVVQHFQGVDWLHDARALERFPGGGFLAVGNLSSHLTYSGVLLPIFFLALGSALDRKARARALRIGGAAVLALAILFTFARSAWAGAAAGLAWLALGFGWRRALAVGVPVAVAIGAAASLEPALSERLASIGEVTTSPRWRLWHTALLIVADHPVFGAGLGAFPTLFPIYRVPGEYLSTIHPHHDVLNVMVETGTAGAIVWIGIWIAFFRESRVRPGANEIERVRRYGSSAPDTSGGHEWSVRGARAGVLALLVAGLGQCFSTDEEVAQLWFFVMTAALVDSGVVTAGGRAPLRRLEKAFKAWSLPLVRLLVAPRTSGGSAASGASGHAGSNGRSGDRDRVLVVRPDDRLGNLLLMTPFLQRLRERCPDAEIGMVTGSAFAPLLEAWPWVDTWIVQPKREHIRRPWRFASWLLAMRRDRWSLALEMSNHNTHSYYSCLLTLASGAPVRIGFAEPRNQDALTRAVAPPPSRRHFSLAPLELLGAMGLPAAPAPMTCPLPAAGDRPTLAECARSIGGRAYLVVHVGGRGGKALPASAWRALLARAIECVEGAIVLVAGPGERERVGRISAARPGGRVVVAPPLDVVSLAHLIEGAGCYVGCDSGVMHLAVALGTPTVAIFFRSNAHHYAPLGALHTSVLLANPDAITPETWQATGSADMERSRLVLAPMNERDSRAGVPATDDRAIATLAGALERTARMPGATLTGDR